MGSVITATRGTRIQEVEGRVLQSHCPGVSMTNFGGSRMSRICVFVLPLLTGSLWLTLLTFPLCWLGYWRGEIAVRLQRGFAESPAAAESETDPECAWHLCGHPGNLATLGESEH